MKRVMFLALLMVFWIVFAADDAFAAMPVGKLGDPYDGVSFEEFLPKTGGGRTCNGIYYGAYNHIASWGVGYHDEELLAVRGYEDYTQGSKKPVLWRVVGEEDGGIVLMSEYVLDAHRFISDDPTNNSWSASDIRQWLNDANYFDSSKSDGKKPGDEEYQSYWGMPWSGFLYGDGEGINREDKRPFTLAELGTGAEGPILSLDVTTGDRFYLLRGGTDSSGGWVSWLANESGGKPSADFLLEGSGAIGATLRNGVPVLQLDDLDQQESVGGLIFELLKSTEINKDNAYSNQLLVSDYWLRTSADPGKALTVKSADNKYSVTSSDIVSDEVEIKRITEEGEEDKDGYIDRLLGVRPVFRLKPQSIIFAAEITSDKIPGHTSASDLYRVSSGNTAKNYKLTILNENLSAGDVTIAGEKFEDLIARDEDRAVSADQLRGVRVMTKGIKIGMRLAYKIVKEVGGKHEIVGYGNGIPAPATGIAGVDIKTASLRLHERYIVYVWGQNDKSLNSHEGSKPEYFRVEVWPAGSVVIDGDGDDDDGGDYDDYDDDENGGGDGSSGGGCGAGFGMTALLTALALGFTVKRSKP
jgi:hypothetical protein